MKTAIENGTPESGLPIRITPETLRTIANRLEARAEHAAPGHHITYKLADGVILDWEIAEQKATQLLGTSRSDLTQ